MIRSRLLPVVLAAVLTASACGGASDVPPAFHEVQAAGAVAAEALATRRWDDAILAFRKQADAAARDEHLAGWRDQALYNLACALARAGRPAEAARALGQSLEHGLRDAQAPNGRGGWTTVSPPVTLEHVLADPDLDPARSDAAYRQALAPYLEPYVAAGEPVVVFEHALPGAPLPFVLWMMGPADVKWPAGPLGERGAALGRQHGAIAPKGPGTTTYDWDWLLADGGSGPAVAAVRRVADDLLAADFSAASGWLRDVKYDTERLFLFAADAEAADAAFAAALAMPERIAGFAAPGVRTHRASWADALAAVPAARAGKTPWRVVVGRQDEEVAAALTAAGATVVRADTPDLVAACAKLWLAR